MSKPTADERSAHPPHNVKIAYNAPSLHQTNLCSGTRLSHLSHFLPPICLSRLVLLQKQ